MAVLNKIANEKIREYILENLIDFFSRVGDTDVLRVKSNEIALPVVDCNDEEKFAVITVKVPTGANKGREPYDGYAEAKDYAHKLAEKKIKAEKKRAEKEKKIAHDKKMREEKK